MQKWKNYLMSLVLGSLSCASGLSAAADVSFEAGYRHDSLNFSIQAPLDRPVMKQSTKYKNLDIFQLGVYGKTDLGCNLYFRGSFDWGWIVNGDLENKINSIDRFSSGSYSEYSSYSSSENFWDGGGDFKSNENIVDGRFVLDFSAALGWPFYFCDCSMSLAPVVGYAFNEQNLWVESADGFNVNSAHLKDQSISSSAAGSAACCNGNDKLVSRWFGYFIGLDWNYRPYNDCWSINAMIEYHWANYKAKFQQVFGFEGLNEFSSKNTSAHGWVVGAGFNYDVNSCWTIGLNVLVQDWRSSRTRKNHFAENSNGNSNLANTNRTHVSWNSLAINMSVGRDF